MKRNNIIPMPATEERRRQIQQKLSMQRSLGGGQKQEDFFVRRQEAFVMKMSQMGMDVMQIKDFLEDRGLHEENPELILDHLNDPNYMNILKANFNPAPNQFAGGYNYVNPIGQMMPQQNMMPNMMPPQNMMQNQNVMQN